MATNDTAVAIAGAAGGIGQAVAEAFAADEVHDTVALLDLHESVHEVATQVDGEGYRVDVSDPDDVSEAVAEIESTADITSIVNLAAIFGEKHQPVDEITDEDWDSMIGVNLKGQFHLIREVAPSMLDRGVGTIVNVSSQAGKQGSAVGGVHYSASKSGIFGLSKGLAKQLGPDVRVNCVTPGLINTPPVKDYWTEEEIESHTPELPLERMGEPHEVADVIHFLSSDASSYITGAIIDVDGGSRLV